MAGGVKKELGQSNGRGDMCKTRVIRVPNTSIPLKLEKSNHLFSQIYICNTLVSIYNSTC